MSLVFLRCELFSQQTHKKSQTSINKMGLPSKQKKRGKSEKNTFIQLAKCKATVTKKNRKL